MCVLITKMADFTTISTLVISCLSLISTVLLHLRLKSQCCGNNIDIDPIASQSSPSTTANETVLMPTKAEEP